MGNGRVLVTLLKSRHGRSPPQTAALKALGLTKIRQSKELEANTATLGNLQKVSGEEGEQDRKRGADE